MSGYEIATIVLAIITALAAISWGVLITRGRRLWAGLQELKADYQKAVADGKITDAEKAEIADDVIVIIDEATSIWQTLQNLIFKLREVVKKTQV